MHGGNGRVGEGAENRGGSILHGAFPLCHALKLPIGIHFRYDAR
jgi:hypothetical protein